MKIKLTDSEEGIAFLQTIADAGRHRQPMNAAIGKRVETVLRGYFLTRNAEGNARGWPSQNFWARIRRATAFAGADDARALVVISDPAINQKVFGGTITPKEGKYLALPAIAEAYGKSPRIFDFLLFRPTRNGGALVEAERTMIKIGRRKKDGTRSVKSAGAGWGGRVWYWLVQSVTQEPDADALPSRAVIMAAALDEAGKFFDRLK